jgi:preprotein translocase SecE subunit
LVARNRKRAKERRSRRGTDGPPGVATARSAEELAPDPIAHATPDVELAEAQLALGRPELSEDEEFEPSGSDEDYYEESEPEREPADAGPGGGRGGGGGSGFGGEAGSGGARVAVPGGPADAAEPRLRGFARVLNFLKGSWRELQRVQWPDRRQVMQATGVVIGFVLVAGVYLGVADALAQDLMNFILK